MHSNENMSSRELSVQECSLRVEIKHRDGSEGRGSSRSIAYAPVCSSLRLVIATESRTCDFIAGSERSRLASDVMSMWRRNMRTWVSSIVCTVQSTATRWLPRRRREECEQLLTIVAQRLTGRRVTRFENPRVSCNQENTAKTQTSTSFEVFL